MLSLRVAVVLLLGQACHASVATRSGTSVFAKGANPIRKVVTLMQNMQKEIEAEGKKEEELFDKFMCFCQGNSGALTKAIEGLKGKIERLRAQLEGAEAGKTSAEQDVIQHKKDGAAAASELAEATTIRTKESATNADLIADTKTNLQAVAKAIPALEKGMGGAALMQLGGGRLGKIFDSYSFKDEHDRQNLESFLEGTTAGDYVPASGQIVGILKTMKDDMEAGLKEAEDGEAKSAQAFKELKSSKDSEIAVATESVKTKTIRAGELALTVAETQDALGDSEVELAENQKFAAQLDAQCATKQKEWDERQKLRQQEIAAVGEAIKILNDDDALEVFKKAIPSAALAQEGLSVAFLQRTVKNASPVRKAASIIAQAVHDPKVHGVRFGLMLFTLKSKLKHHEKSAAAGFDGIMTMIDDMVTLEGKEQKMDDEEKPWCNGEFDKTAQEEATEKHEIEALTADLEEKADQIAQIEEDVKSMSDEIADLDKAVAEASEQRKEDHEDFLEEVQMSGVAVGLVEKAKNRLNKFYNPTVYKEPESEDSFFAQIAVKTLRSGIHLKQPEAPETFGAYEKSEGKSSGVIALMDSIIHELKDDIQESHNVEKTAQRDYEELMKNSQEKRLQLSKSIKSQESSKADLSSKRQADAENKDADDNDVLLINKHESDLHTQCDFILENYDVRREARATEMESLKNAKAALAGAGR